MEEENQAVIGACEAAMVCATVCASHFSYTDEASLAERIGACNELGTCCEALLEAIDDDDDLKSVRVAAELCLEQCKETAGTEEQEGDGDAHPETDSTATVVSKADAKRPVNKDWLKVEARADGVHMVISGFIGADVLDESGTSETEFTNALKKISADQHIHLHVDSEGGSLPAGMAIYNALKARRPNVTTHIDGVALSCASLVALSGETVISPLASVWMIHSARIQTYGDDQEHKKAIKMLKSFSDMMADVYAEETGHSKEEILSLMEKESWFTGAEAVEFGLADDIDEQQDQDQGENDEDEQDGIGARSRYAAVVAMYRPPEKIRELISSAPRAGVTGTAASNSENQNQSMGNENKTTVAAASTAASNPFEARLMQERTARITAEVTRRAEGRIKNDQLKWWIDTAAATLTSAEEQAVYAQIEAMPVAKAAPGGNPLPADDGRVRAQFAEGERIVAAHDLRWGADAPRPRTAFAEHLRRLPSSQRVAVHRREWTEHFGHCIKEDLKAGVDPKLPVAANTYSSTLITDFLVDVAVTVLQNRWPALECVTRDFSTDRYKPLATGQVKLVAAGATTLVGTKSSAISSFETGDSTVRNIPVVLNHYSQPFHVGQDELMNGLRLENLTTINLSVLADTIISNVLQALASGAYNTSGNLVAFSGGTVNALAGTFSWNSSPGMPTLWGRLKKSPIKNAILDGIFMANLINQPGFYQPTFNGDRDSGRARTFGWDNIQENTGNWPSSMTNLGGFACNPQAIVAVAGLPQVPPTIPGATLNESVITIPGPDISIASYLWFSLASRTLWNSFDVVFGSAGGDATAGVLLFNQTGGI